MPATLLKKRLWHRRFPVNFVKFLRTSFLQNTSGRLLLTFFGLSTVLTMNGSTSVAFLYFLVLKLFSLRWKFYDLWGLINHSFEIWRQYFLTIIPNFLKFANNIIYYHSQFYYNIFFWLRFLISNQFISN